MGNWLLLFFLLPFHVVGALALTLMLRQWQEEERSTQAFILVWALFFLGIPFFMQVLAAPYCLLVTVPLTAGIPLLCGWTWDTLRTVFRQPGIPAILVVSVALYFEMLALGLLSEGEELPPSPLFVVLMGALTLGLLWLWAYSALKWWRWWQAESTRTHIDEG
ncbi:MAG: hypothetical protein U9Q70_04325 [Chloroflexota bacterium]|nr:hypothetical protein [Chloroflexota bacterium]